MCVSYLVENVFTYLAKHTLFSWIKEHAIVTPLVKVTLIGHEYVLHRDRWRQCEGEHKHVGCDGSLF